MVDHVRAWHPEVPSLREVYHARFDHSYPMHTHDDWAVMLVDDGAVAYGLDRGDQDFFGRSGLEEPVPGAEAETEKLPTQRPEARQESGPHGSEPPGPLSPSASAGPDEPTEAGPAEPHPPGPHDRE